MIISRSTPGSKLLARYEYDKAAFPFATADWETTAGSFSLSGGALVHAGGTVGAYNAARRVGSTARASTFVQAVFRVPNSNYPALVCHFTDITPASFNGVGMFLQIDGTSLPTILREFVNSGAASPHAGDQLTSSQTKAINTDYRVVVHGDGLAIGGYDFANPNHLTRDASTQDEGRTGVLRFSNTALHIRRWFECPSRFVTVTGLPSGAVVQVRNSIDAVLATANEDGSGTAAVSMHSVVLETAVKLVVLQFGDILATYEPSSEGIIEPGETYTLTDPPLPVITAPVVGSTQTSPIAVAWDAFSFGTGNPVDYELDYSLNDVTWTTIASDIAGLAQAWAAADALVGLPIILRLRAHDTVTDELSEYGYVSFRMAGYATYEDVVLADEPLEYWKLEEAAGDFLTSSPDGFDATPGTAVGARDQPGAVCKGIETVNPGAGHSFFVTQRPIAQAFIDDFAIEIWCRPDLTTALSNPAPVGDGGSLSCFDRAVVTATHGAAAQIGNGSPTAVGFGVEIGTNGFCLRRHTTNNLSRLSRYEGTGIAAGLWNQFVVVVRRLGFRRTLELYLNGQYCGDLPGTYVESFFDNAIVGSWPDMGQSLLNVMLPCRFGVPFDGGVDEVSWYGYALTPEQIARHYAAGVVTGIAAPGAFTNPIGNVQVGVPVLVEWGDAVGADAYVLELWNGSIWEFLAEVAVTEYLWIPDATQANAQLRVVGTAGGYADSCTPLYTQSVIFHIISSNDLAPPARKAWAFMLDGHVFYVIGSFDDMTLLYDSTTGQWCRWKTGERRFWNMHRGIMWRGRVLAADRELPIIWELDPSTPLDEEVTEISRAVTGFQPVRGDENIRQGSMRMIARQQTGVAVDAVLTLRFSDDGGRTWSQPRTLDLANATERLEFRSLGRLRKPGRIWEITDTGGLIRIDGAEGNLGDG
jgi:hypothetical protein